jgi:hypothetical protein
VGDERDRPKTTYCERVRNAEVPLANSCPRYSYYVGEVIRDPQTYAVIYASDYQQFRLRVMKERVMQVVVGEQAANRRVLQRPWYVIKVCDRN